jgi:fructose-1,6-bisphosphatase
MSAALYDISIEKRACFSLGLTFTNTDGSPYNLSGVALTGEIRRDFDNALQAVFNTQILNTESGTAIISLTSEQTLALDTAASSYDIFADRLDGCPDKLMYGSVTNIDNKTR